MGTSVNRQLEAMARSYERLVPNYLQDILDRQQQYQEMAEAVAGPVLRQLRAFQQQLNIAKAFDDRFLAAIESSKRWTDALTIVQSKLPERGWYLTGKESCRLTERLAGMATEERWAEIDELLVEQASSLTVNVEAFAEWLKQNEVLDCCIDRVRIFLKARDERNHEVATLVGVPLIDEVCRALYDGKDFTTKRGKQPKPQLACKTGSGTPRLNHYCEGFVDAFGLIHHNVDTARVEDEDYFNRSAIVHGMMRRGYGPKDSAKTFMALMFVVFALEEGSDEGATDAADDQNDSQADADIQSDVDANDACNAVDE